MQTLKYIGLKEHGHTSFTKLTGIVWYPGDVHQVKPEHAKVMLRHPDCFEAVAEPAGKTEAPAPAGVTLAPGAQVVAKPTETVVKPVPAKKAARKNAKKAKA